MANVMIYTQQGEGWRVSFQYNPMLVRCVKRIPSARYQPDTKTWFVSGGDKRYLEMMGDWAVRKLLCVGVSWRTEDTGKDYIIPPLPKLDVDLHMCIEPYPYQKRGIAYALKKKRCLMGDEPGLGKTIQAIGVVQGGNAYPALVICPASLKLNWQREFKKFAGVNAIVLDDNNKNNWHHMLEMENVRGEKVAKVVITNYESLKKFFVVNIREHKRLTIKAIEFDKRIALFRSVIIDESHKCKSSRTQQSKFVQGIAAGKEYILELTGTPVVNDNSDLIQQLNIMGRLEDFGGYRKFTERYCGMEYMGAQMRKQRLKELNYYLNQYCFFRREKRDVLKELPDKTRTYLVTEIDNRKEYRDAERDVIEYLRKYRDADDEKIQRALRGEVMVKMGILKQVSARGKTAAAVEFIHNMTDGGKQKLIVFCFLRQVVEDLKREFPDAVTVTGDDNTEQKQNAVDRFQTDDGTKLIILNYRSGGTGLTLTAASDVLFVEFPWTYADCCQAEDRAHRNGQKNAVTCTYLLGKGTIDEYMYNLIQSKKELANGVTGADDQVLEKKVTAIVMDAAMDLFGGKI